MFCPNCGAQIPDGAQSCMQCGISIPANTQPMQSQDVIPQPAQTQPMQPQGAIPQPVQSQSVQPQPMQPNSGAQQSGFNSQPAFGSVQPSYIPPSNYAPVTPIKKSNKKPIIIACCAAVVVVAAVLFFVLIFPNLNRGPLEHRWSATESGITVTYDFKNNKMSAMGMEIPFEWKEESNNRISITVEMLGISQTQYLTYELSSDGKTLTLTDEDGLTTDFTRAD